MSLLEKLQNTIAFKVNNLVSDPAADTYAAEQKQKEQQEKANAEQVKRGQANQAAAAEEKRKQEEAKAKQLSVAKTTMNSALRTFLIIMGVLGSCVLGSMAANAGIHRHILIRILYFIYGSAIGAIITLFAMNIPPLIVLFACILFFLYLTNNLPHMYAFIPITKMKPESWIGALVLWPFRWDPADHQDHYIANMDKYRGLLQSGLAVATGAPLLEKVKPEEE